MRRVAEGNLDASLVTDDGSQVKPIRVDMSEKMTHTFDLIFPRMKDGVPLIKEGQKQFSVQFQSPVPRQNSVRLWNQEYSSLKSTPTLR
jgi:hypothetical protein